MLIDPDILNQAIQYLIDGNEIEAANYLRTCSVEGWDIVDSWMDGNRSLDGILIELACPRNSYEILTDESNPLTKSVKQALDALLPSGMYLKEIHIRAITSSIPVVTVTASSLGEPEKKELIQRIETQRALMIAVATGGPRIQVVNQKYKERRLDIKDTLLLLSIDDPNPYPDLWPWYGKWSDGSLPTYQSRRTYITSLYQPLLDALYLSTKNKLFPPSDPTGWARVDRNVDKIVRALETSNNEEDFQTVGLLCREAMISLAQAVYDPEQHPSLDGVTPSKTDAKRKLESYIAKELSGGSHAAHRKFTRALYDLTVKLQHQRTAEFRDAALCAEATRSLINTIAIISGLRDPEKKKR